jgi:hypothetical protein
MISLPLAAALQECRAKNSPGPLVRLLVGGFKPTAEELEHIAAIPFGPMTPAKWRDYQADALADLREYRAEGMRPGAARERVKTLYPFIDDPDLDKPGPAVRARADKIQKSDEIGNSPTFAGEFQNDES